MDPTSSSLNTPTIPSILEFCDNGHTFKFPHDQLPKHKIFISHSGKQKNFAEQLCEDLEGWGYYPFFDKRPHSLPKGENFPNLILEATRECFLAIVLLSEAFFTRSKWPMIELASCVEAQKSRKYLRILPVLLDLSVEDLKNIERWSTHWKNWEKVDTRVNYQDICKWENAVKSLKPVNMLMQGSYEGEVALRKEILQVVLNMMPPDIQSNVAHVQGKERLYKEIVSRFSNIPPSSSMLGKNAKVLGVYGIAGAGKSTLCMILTYFLRKEFQGRVCHVELDEEVNTVKLQCRALQQLTGANQDYLNRHINCKEEGSTCLMDRMHRQRVFLAIDNVSDIAKSLESAEMFLEPSFYPDSMVLVTSRSKDVLHTRLGIPESCCMPCPQVNAQEASKIVLNHIHISSTEILTKEQRNLLQQTLDSCNFEGSGGFHPLSLKVLASQMGCNPPSWKVGDLQEASDIEHPLFSAIETNFSRLPDQLTRDIFMDIALFRPESANTVHDISMWLDDTLHDIKSLETKLRNLRMKSLLEFWSSDADIVRLHDLNRELAKRKARVEGISHGTPPRFVYQKGGEAIAAVFSSRQLAKHIERAGFVECSFTTASFEKCSNLKRLCIRSCEKIETLSLDGLLSLASLEVFSCQLEHLKLKGLVSLRWLCVDSCGELLNLDVNGLEDLRCVQVSRCSSLLELKLADCNKLKSLSVSYNVSLVHVDLGSGQSLQCLTLWFCEDLTYVRLTEATKGLSELKKRGCPKLLNIQGDINVSNDVKCLIVTRWQSIPGGVITALAKSRHLRVLDLWDCPMGRLPDLRSCSDLFELRLSDLDVLLDSADRALWKEYAAILAADDESLQLPAALQDVQIASCRNVVVKEVCWKLQGLKNLAVLSMQRVRVAWDWELYLPIEQKGSTASFHACDRTSSISEVEMSIKALHLDIDINREAEMVSGEEEEECSSEEASNDNVDLSDEGASSDNADLLVDGDTLNKGDSSSEGLHQGVGYNIVSCVRQILYWVQEYLENTANDSPLEGEVNQTFKFYRGKNMVDPSIVVSEDAGLFWERMIMTLGRIRNLQFGIIEQTLLETCDSCDTACEQICEKLSVQCLKQPRLRKANKLVKALTSGGLEGCLIVLRGGSELEDVYAPAKLIQRVSAEELKAQLDVLEAISPQGMLKHDDLEMWEEEIIHELATYEKVQSFGKTRESVMWENRLREERILLRLPSVETLKKRLDKLIECRKWQATIGMAEEMKKKRGDWLRSWKICMLIEQLLCFVERRGKGTMDKEYGGSPSNFQWLREVVKKIDLLLKNVTNLNSSQVRGMLRGWKTRQWLQMIVSCLSQDFAAGEIRLRSVDRELNKDIKATYAPLFYRLGNYSVASKREELMKRLEDILEMLGPRMREKQSMRELPRPNVHLTWENGKREFVDLQENALYLEILSSENAEHTSAKPVHIRYKNGEMEVVEDLLEDTLHPEDFSFNHLLDQEMKASLQVVLGRNVGDQEMQRIRDWQSERFDGSWTETVHKKQLLLAHILSCSEEEVARCWGAERAKIPENLVQILREENLAERLRMLSGYVLMMGSKENAVVQMWERSLEVASDLVDYIKDEWTVYRFVKFVERETKAICDGKRCEWSFPFAQKLEYMIRVQREVLRFCLSAVPKTAQRILSAISEAEDVIMTEQSQVSKLIEHFLIMEEVHWKYGARSNRGVALFTRKLRERVGSMAAFLMPQPEEILEEGEPAIWRRAESFPLRQQWNYINRDQNFILPITHCTKLRHRHFSDCKLKIPSSYAGKGAE